MEMEPALVATMVLAGVLICRPGAVRSDFATGSTVRLTEIDWETERCAASEAVTVIELAPGSTGMDAMVHCPFVCMEADPAPCLEDHATRFGSVPPETDPESATEALLVEVGGD